MRILHELNCLELGGAERTVLNIAANDRENEHVVYAWADGPFRAEFEAAGIHVFLRDVPVSKPDVVHVHTGGHESRLALMLEGWPRNSSPPVVETIQSPLPSAVRADLVTRRIAVSMHVATFTPGCDVIYNGIDFRRLEPVATRAEAREALGIRPDAFVVGWLGRIVPEKNLDLWLQVVESVNAMRETLAVLVGPEPGAPPGQWDYGCLLQNGAHDAGLELRMPGARNPGRAIPAFDVFLSCSMIEAHPLTYVEAMWLKAPVVVVDEPVNREAVGDGRHAMVAPASVELLRNAVLNSRWRAVEDIERAHEYAAEFTVERMVHAYQGVYADAYARGRP